VVDLEMHALLIAPCGENDHGHVDFTQIQVTTCVVQQIVDIDPDGIVGAGPQRGAVADEIIAARTYTAAAFDLDLDTRGIRAPIQDVKVEYQFAAGIHGQVLRRTGLQPRHTV